MAGDWIKMRADLFTHPKVVRMKSALKADALRTVGGLMSVWCLFDQHSADGVLEGYTPELIDDHLNWPGFAAAMVAVAWLIYSGENLALPRFDAHNGQSAKRRAQDADRKKEVRKVSASEADKKRTREEKRREEEIGKVTKSVETEVSADEASTRAQCAKRLRSLGMLDVHPGRAELFEVLRDGFTEQVLADTAAELAGKKGGKPPNLNFLIATVRGRRDDAANAQRQQPAGKPSITDNFQDAVYVGTPVEQLPPEFREAISGLG
jgi:hypothetical protein